MESCTEGIANDLEDMSVLGLNGLMQYLMVPRKQSGHGIWILLGKLGRAFNIGEEEGNGASGESLP
jgi:hypothetical protein